MVTAEVSAAVGRLAFVTTDPTAMTLVSVMPVMSVLLIVRAAAAPSDVVLVR